MDSCIINKRQSIGARNAEIELFRFLFAVGIMLAHYGQTYGYGFFSNGAIGVEYFLLLSGLLMARSAEKAQRGEKQPLGSATWSFLKKKILVFYPYYVLVLISQFVIVRGIIQRCTLNVLIRSFLNAIPQFFLLEPVTGAYVAGGPYSMGISGRWYLSAMIWGMAFLYPILLRKNDLSRKLLFPIIAAFSLGYLQQNYGTIRQTYGWGSVCGLSLLRAIGEMALGVICYELVKGLKNILPRLTKLGRLALFLLKLGCFLIAFLHAASVITLPFLTVALIIAAGLTVAFAGEGVYPVGNRLCLYLGKLSLPLYLVHVPVKTVVVNWLSTQATKPYAGLIMVGCVLLAALIMYIMPLFIKALKNCKPFFIRADE